MPPFQITVKSTLRKNIKNLIKNIPNESKRIQSKQVTHKILTSDVFKNSKRISIYLSTENEIDTNDILHEMFKQKKQVFVPSYDGNRMEMLKIHNLNDYNSLPKTKWNIKQPHINDNERENALQTGGLDLFIIPGVAFTRQGGRLGHGKGYYDKYLSQHFKLYPEKYSSRNDLITIREKLNQNKTILIGLGFKEQILDDEQLPLDPHDFVLDYVVTSD